MHHAAGTFGGSPARSPMGGQHQTFFQNNMDAIKWLQAIIRI